MATIGDFFEEQAILEFRDRVYEAMEKRGVCLADVAEMIACDVEELENMLESGEGLTIHMVARILFNIGYRPMVSISPLGRSHFEQADHWTKG